MDTGDGPGRDLGRNDMQHDQTAVFWRHDTFLGVCEALGQDFGFHPNWLRVAFALGLLPSPMITLSLYLGLGVLVAVSRFAFPARRKAVVEAASAPAADNDAASVELAAAA
jgi:phage shock protein PspC (stress-responsive transcriptional regulator)